MQWIKSHLSLVITIVIGVLGITGLAMGIVMSDTAAKMQQDQSTLSSLGGIKGTNNDAIEQARTKSNQVKADLDKALKEFEAIGNHVPILPDIFPKLLPGSAAAFKFTPEYRKALAELRTKLHAIDPPGQKDFQIETDAINNEKTKAERERTIGVDRPQTR